MINLLGAVKAARARATLAIMARGAKIKGLVATEIPSSLGLFFDTEAQWAKVEFPSTSNVTSCIYNSKKGTTCEPHKHEGCSEHLVILNKKGKIKAITQHEIKVIEYPGSMVFRKNEAHAIVFLEDTELLAIWHPEMKNGWNAIYINPNDEK